MLAFLNACGILDHLTCSTDDDLESELVPSTGKRKQGQSSIWFFAFLHFYPFCFFLPLYHQGCKDRNSNTCWNGSCWVKRAAPWVDTSIYMLSGQKRRRQPEQGSYGTVSVHSHESVHLFWAARDRILKPPDLWLTFFSPSQQKVWSILLSISPTRKGWGSWACLA